VFLATSTLTVALMWLVSVVAFIELGRLAAHSKKKVPGDAEQSGFGALEGCVFGLFGLLIAFTFSGAASRFDSRRLMIADEANAIGTAYLRVDLLPSDAQPRIRTLFSDYVGSRLKTYRLLPDVEAAERELMRSQSFQKDIWDFSRASTEDPKAHVDAGKLLLPALNAMFDIVTTRTMGMRTHPPAIVFVLLFAVGLVCALLIGYRTARSPRNWFYVSIYAAVTAVCFYVILDLEYPRTGLIHLQEFDRVLVELHESMKD
jgi:hypothetical protein